MSKNQKAFLLVLFILILSFSSILLVPDKEGISAQISVDGQIVMTLDLSEDRIVKLDSFGRNIILEVKDQKIRFLSSDCSNKICVNTGFIGSEGETAVCLPNKTAVIILGKEG